MVGRRRTHYVFSTLNLLAQLAALYVPIYKIKLLAMGTLGVTMVKNSLCYVWLFEFLMKKDKSAACSFRMGVNFC